jgi:hypothetical protein
MREGCLKEKKGLIGAGRLMADAAPANIETEAIVL